MRNIPPRSLDVLAEQIYKIRSNIVHKAFLGGLDPFGFDFIIPNIDLNKAKLQKPIKPKWFDMINQETF